MKPFVLTEARTLTDSDSGRTYFLNSLVGFEVTLPAPRAGISFDFIVKTIPTTTGADYVIGAKDDDKIILGQIVTSNVIGLADVAIESSGASQLKFLFEDIAIGDSAEFISDGTYWYATAFCSNHDAITIAEQSKSPSASTSASPSTSPSVSPSTST